MTSRKKEQAAPAPTEMSAAQDAPDEAVAAPAEVVPAEAETSPDPEPQATDQLRPHAVIVGPAHGRRRAGHQFGPGPVAIPLEDLTEDQQSALANDPQLSCRIELR